jgi:choline dehydrogenase-like flavoprotein
MEATRCDVLIVGSGIMGACVARTVHDLHPGAGILMLDAGPVLGPTAGQHLYDMPDGELRVQYDKRVSSGIQGHYVGAEVTEDLGAAVTELEPGMYRLSSFGEQTSAMPAAALAWNAGGMGVHWTAATPPPWGSEVPDFIDAEEWAADLKAAADILGVNGDPFGRSPLRDALIGALNDVFAAQVASGRQVQPLPMAINRDARGGMIRSGPNRIYPPISGRRTGCFELRTGSQVVALLRQDGGVRGAVVRDVATGTEHTVQAEQVVVCADVFRTPQLLFASGIRPSALGRYLNEHMFLSAQAAVDPDHVDLDVSQLAAGERTDDWLRTNLWLPHSDATQPFNGQFSGGARYDVEGRLAELTAGLALYVPTEIRAENRVEFSETELDAAGMPRMSIAFDYSERDRRLLERARQVQTEAGQRVGAFDPETDAALLPPGTSLHMTGTVRMGAADDGTSVCDPTGRVWTFENLFVAGCGVIPTALVGNSTLTGAVTAVRAARAVVDGLMR